METETPKIGVGVGIGLDEELPASEYTTNYQKEAILQEKNHLKYYTEQANAEVVQQQEDNRFINLSIKQILMNLSATLIAILNESLDSKNHRDIGSFITIFFKEDRMIYIGILLLLIAIGFYIVDITK